MASSSPQRQHVLFLTLNGLPLQVTFATEGSSLRSLHRARVSLEVCDWPATCLAPMSPGGHTPPQERLSGTAKWSSFYGLSPLGLLSQYRQHHSLHKTFIQTVPCSLPSSLTHINSFNLQDIWSMNWYGNHWYGNHNLKEIK